MKIDLSFFFFSHTLISVCIGTAVRIRGILGDCVQGPLKSPGICFFTFFQRAHPPTVKHFSICLTEVTLMFTHKPFPGYLLLHTMNEKLTESN